MSGEIFSTVLNIIIYAGIVQGFYSAVILTHTKLRNPANQYLAYLLVILSISIVHSVFIIPYFHNYHQTDFHLKEPFILLVIPFLWLYVKKLNEPDFKFRLSHLLHFAPFIVVMVYSVFFLVHKPLRGGKELNSHTLAGNIILYTIAVGQYLFYLVYILRILNSFKRKALNELSNTENIDPEWLRIFLFTFLAVFILLILMVVIAIHRLEVGYFNDAVSLIFAMAIYVAGYKGLFQQTIPVKPDLKTDAIPSSKSFENTIDEKLLQRVLDYMASDKPYHDSELTLTSLATQLNIGRNQLSEIINTGTGGNFYDFVNKYRVEEVKQLMANPKFKDYTILAIAFEAGFASKSTFNSIFRKATGVTPSEYKIAMTKT